MDGRKRYGLSFYAEEGGGVLEGSRQVLRQQALRPAIVDATPVWPEGLICSEARDAEARRRGKGGAPGASRIAEQDVDAIAGTECPGELLPTRFGRGVDSRASRARRPSTAAP